MKIKNRIIIKNKPIIILEEFKFFLNIHKEILKRKYIKEKKYYINSDDNIDKKINIEIKKKMNKIEDSNKDLEKLKEDLYDKNEIELDKYEKKIKSYLSK